MAKAKRKRISSTKTGNILKLPTMRFTIDVPVELHRRVKAECARRGVKMADMVRELLERKFPSEWETRK